MAKENLIGHQKFKFKLTKEGQTILKVEVEGHNFAFWKFGNWQLWQLWQCDQGIKRLGLQPLLSERGKCKARN